MFEPELVTDSNAFNAARSVQNEQATMKTSPVCAVDFEEELSRFVSTFCRSVRANGKLDPSCHFDEQLSSIVMSGSHDGVRAVVKKEFQSFIDQMPDLDFHLHKHVARHAPNRSTVIAVKRRVPEKSGDVERLQRVINEKEVECRKLQEKLQQVQVDKDETIAESSSAKASILIDSRAQEEIEWSP